MEALFIKDNRDVQAARQLAIRSPHRDASPASAASVAQATRQRVQTPPYIQSNGVVARVDQAGFRTTHLYEHDLPRLTQNAPVSRSTAPAKSAAPMQQQRPVQSLAAAPQRQVAAPPLKQPQRPPPLQYAPSYPPRQAPPPPVRSNYWPSPAYSVRTTRPSPTPYAQPLISTPSRQQQQYGAIRQHATHAGGHHTANNLRTTQR